VPFQIVPFIAVSGGRVTNMGSIISKDNKNMDTTG